jgi:16S rRNA (adenine1518-N6/adenine1519-N6)-dimethyltransferase
MTVSEMRQILSDRGIQLTKSLGQNFLHDGNQLRRIVEAAQLSADENVLEIGPGLGPLTELLLQKSGHVLAIEMDQRLVNFLDKRFNDPKLELVRGDGLQVARDKARDWSNWKLVANLPYSVASPILVELAENPNAPKTMTVTLQIEVAQRIQAKAGDDDFGLLSLLLQIRYEPSGFFKIPSASFFPAPDVDSACITLQLRREPLLPIELLPKFKRIVKKALSERRKMMMKLLKQEWPAENLQSCFAAIGLSPQVRAEAVSLEQFVALTTCLTSNPA